MGNCLDERRSPPRECPICFEAFDLAERTEIRPFACPATRHAVCAKCDVALFVRGDDRCPMCRAGRSRHSLHRHNADASAVARRQEATAMATAPGASGPLVRIFFETVPPTHAHNSANSATAVADADHRSTGSEGGVLITGSEALDAHTRRLIAALIDLPHHTPLVVFRDIAQVSSADQLPRDRPSAH